MKKLLMILFAFSFCSTYSQTDHIIDELEYYPLRTGNYFEYISNSWEFPFYSSSSAYSVKIVGDTLMSNGKQYKILLNKNIPDIGEGHYSYERIDTISGYVYLYANNYSYEEDEFLFDNIYAKVGDTLKCSRGGISNNPKYFSTLCLSVVPDTILGISTYVKIFQDQSFIPGLDYKLAYGLGLISSSSCEGSCHTTNLVYAEINGKIFGNTITSAVDPKETVPPDYELFQNYPNPFNPTTTINYSVPKQSMVTIKIFDVLGREITTLVDEEKPIGSYETKFNADGLSSGVYFYQIRTDGFIQTKKMVLLK